MHLQNLTGALPLTTGVLAVRLGPVMNVMLRADHLFQFVLYLHTNFQ